LSIIDKEASEAIKYFSNTQLQADFLDAAVNFIWVFLSKQQFMRTTTKGIFELLFHP
jgi:hypothetical protein